MPSLEEIKNLVDKLNPEQQIELAGYATKKWKEAKKSAEEILPILTLSSPFTDSDKAFVQQHEKNKKINFSKIKFAENIIEIDGLKFPRTVGTYNDVKDIP